MIGARPSSTPAGKVALRRIENLVWMPAVMQGKFRTFEHVIECGLVSGFSVAAVHMPRAGMVMRGSGPKSSERAEGSVVFAGFPDSAHAVHACEFAQKRDPI
jgi:hypothetical protein